MIGWGYLYTGNFIQATMTKKKNVYTSHVYIFGSLTSESLYTKYIYIYIHNCLDGKLLMVGKKVISMMGLDKNQ